MPTVFEHAPYETIATAASTELNSLANSSYALGAVQDNTSLLDLFDDLWLQVTFGSAPTAGTSVDVYLIPSIDDTNYIDGSSSVAPQPSQKVASFALRAVTSAQSLGALNIQIPPGKFKYLVYNGSGQSFPSSGSTLQRRAHKLQSA